MVRASSDKSLPLALILYSPLSDGAPADELDVLDEAAYFKQGLEQLGYHVSMESFLYDLERISARIQSLKPNLVVNLVETLFGSGKLTHIGAGIFDWLGVVYTGSSAESIFLTSNKLLAKEIMLANGILTPGYYTYDELCHHDGVLLSVPFLVKSVWEHASFGLNEGETLLFYERDKLLSRFQRGGSNPVDSFAEQYIHGREFNISLLAGEQGPEVLPVAEIRFDYPDDKARIVGYRAKWDIDSFEFGHTVRSFEFEKEDHGLLQTLCSICLKCWNLFKLRGYARIDFRVDQSGLVYVLEINANPCISVDSGFVAAASRAGLSQAEVIQRIIDDSFRFSMRQPG